MALRWLSIAEVMAVHARQIEEFGGAPGVRDPSVVASALARPLNKAAYEPGVSVSELAATLAYGLARNHGFVDGNKRTALASSAVFLRLNGHRLDATDDDAVKTFLALAGGALDEATLSDWYQARVAPLSA